MTGKIKVGTKIVLLKNNAVLLGKNLESNSGENGFVLPGGELKFREDLRDCVYRCVSELTGIKLNKNSLQMLTINNEVFENSQIISICFLCSNFEGEVLENSSWEWHSVFSLPLNLSVISEKVLGTYLELVKNISGR